PDGGAVVYSGDVGGIRKLFVKRIGGPEAEQLTVGDRDDVQPAWSPDGRQIVFVRAREPRRRIEPGDVFAAYESDAGDVWSIDLASHREERLVENAFYPDFSPDGRSIAVDASRGGPRRIWIMDVHGLNPQQATTDSSEAVAHIAPRWSPDGRRIVYQRIERTRFDVAVVDLASRQSITVTRDVYRKINPVWARDGHAIYYSSDAGGGMNVWRLPIDEASRPSAPAQQLTSGAGQDLQVAVAPDGNRLVYATLHQNADLWRLPVTPQGAVVGVPEPLVATTREDSRGEWSPDGRQVAFNSDRAGPMNVWIHSLATGTNRQVTSGPGGDFQPSWSPDGRLLAFFSSRGGQTETDIWTVDIGTGVLSQLTRNRSIDINPFFSPDGRDIVFQSDASGRLELWLMRTDGSSLRQLTRIGATGHFVRWRADGFIYFRSPSSTGLLRVSPTGGEPRVVAADVGSHMSFSPDGERYVDVKGHKVLSLYAKRGAPRKLFEFEDAEVRIDYPVWSPDGRSLLFDRFRPNGGDLWMLQRPPAN
nr:PD40 domain-containing protein [Gemmatimonadaceae bacterium]